MELAYDSEHELGHDEDQDFGGMAKENCNHCDRGPSVIANRLTSIKDTLVFIRKLMEKKSRRSSKCVSSSVRSNRKRIRKVLQFVNAKKIKGKLVSRKLYDILSIYVLFTSVNFDPMNALDGSPLSHPDHVDDVHDGPSHDQVDDASCKTLPLPDPAHDGPSNPLTDHVHNDDGPSSPLPDQVDDVSCKTLPGEVVDSAVDSEDRSPDEIINDVLAQIHGKDDIEEFGDAAQNGYRLPMKKPDDKFDMDQGNGLSNGVPNGLSNGIALAPPDYVERMISRLLWDFGGLETDIRDINDEINRYNTKHWDHKGWFEELNKAVRRIERILTILLEERG
ncbi:hypothetical protein K7X08_013872 [Anisodus acutangulus]|uniref:Uncharacterized protein n=1 Tax=Anisodus acutangulus TaxID=402998 RepID=A0A9Q1R5N7_9SOLA|nr:hypothetical protein K7X08_013872 [Anisodus acutangulus]